MKAPSEVRYARADDGIDVAYQTSGSGDRWVLMVHGFTTHLDLMWDSPWHAAWASQLGEHFRVIHFDKRGTGLSDRSLGVGSIEQRSRDLVAVMNAAGVERAGVVGISEGAPMSLVMAATQPERIDRLVIYGGFARILVAEDYPDGYVEDVARQLVDWMVNSWGTGECFGRMFVESAESVIPTLAHFERNACTRQMVGEIMAANLQIDVRPLLPLVAAPTLVIHNTGDPITPASWGRAIADLVPGARYLPFEGSFHCTSYVDKALPRIQAAVEFLLGPEAPAHRPTSRALASVLFTDIVGSTEAISAMGDGAWREVLEQHDRRTRAVIADTGGHFVKTTGDGVLATFDGPSDAIRCARSVVEAMRPLDMAIRAGVHTGEIEHRGDDVGGIGVHLAARVAALASPGEVLVSRTVRDLTLGSDLQFAARGTHCLKGVPGEWEVFAVT